MGDPYYLADSGMGNYSAAATEFIKQRAVKQFKQVLMMIFFLPRVILEKEFERKYVRRARKGLSFYSFLPINVVGIFNAK